jgi:hypothetical protein
MSNIEEAVQELDKARRYANLGDCEFSAMISAAKAIHLLMKSCAHSEHHYMPDSIMRIVETGDYL